jgi:hypothetical protein
MEASTPAPPSAEVLPRTPEAILGAFQQHPVAVRGSNADVCRKRCEVIPHLFLDEIGRCWFRAAITVRKATGIKRRSDEPDNQIAVVDES